MTAADLVLSSPKNPYSENPCLQAHCSLIMLCLRVEGIDILLESPALTRTFVKTVLDHAIFFSTYGIHLGKGLNTSHGAVFPPTGKRVVLDHFDREEGAYGMNKVMASSKRETAGDSTISR